MILNLPNFRLTYQTKLSNSAKRPLNNLSVLNTRHLDMPTNFPSSTLGIDLPSPPKGEEFIESLLPSHTRVTSDVAKSSTSYQAGVDVALLSSQARVMSDYSVNSSSSQTRVTKEVSVSSLLDDEATMEDLEAADIDEEVVKSLVKGNDFSELFEPTEVVSLSPPNKKLHTGCDDNGRGGASTEDSKETVSDACGNSNASSEETVSSERAEGGEAGEILLVPLSEESRVLDRFQRRGQGGGGGQGGAGQSVGGGQGGDGGQGGGGGQGVGSRVVQGRLTDWLVSPYSGNRLKPYIRCCQKSCNHHGSS